jgi:hypothetical protein
VGVAALAWSTAELLETTGLIAVNCLGCGSAAVTAYRPRFWFDVLLCRTGWSGCRDIIKGGITQMSACTAAAWRRHFETAAFLFERVIVPTMLEHLSDLDHPDDLARWPGPLE